jgi:hypothetical protein
MVERSRGGSEVMTSNIKDLGKPLAHSQKVMEPDTRPPKRGWAPGNYICRCLECGDHFSGTKRAIHCADCASKDMRVIEMIIAGCCFPSNPHMSGDPRARLNAVQRRRVEDAAISILEEIKKKYLLVDLGDGL